MDSASGLLLASTSPRRREILGALRLDFSVCPVDVDETPAAGEPAEAMVLRLAAAKVEAADCGPAALVLGADTAVVADDQILGKPLDEADCLEMLGMLSGGVHQVVTGVALRTSAGTRTAVSTTDVYFREIRRDEAQAYWQSGEPCDKAGAYAIQGLGGAFVTRIDGSYSGVVGLPVFETLQLLNEAGLTVFTSEKQ